MSGLKHGLFSLRFMLCDRCSSNTKCERFVPGKRCILEEEAFKKAVEELTVTYELDSVADKFLAERFAMTYIRITRAEAYEATIGINEKIVNWDAYIGKLENTLTRLLNDLAIDRKSRMNFDKSEGALISFDKVMRAHGCS